MHNHMQHSPVRSLRRVARWAALGTMVVGSFVACNSDDVTVPVTAASVEVTPRLSTVTVGATVQLTAQAKDANGNNMANDAVVWASLDTNVARVSASGLVTVLQSGATAITAATRGATGFASIDINGTVATVQVTGVAGIPIGGTTQLTATPMEASGRELFRAVSWTSSSPAVATVSATGFVTSVSVGTTVISATSEGKVGTFTLTVLPPPPVATVALSPTSGFMPSTVGVPLTVTLRDAANNVLADARVVTWSTSDANVATVSTTGVVTGVAPGPVTITATSEGKSASATFNVRTGLKNATPITFSNATTNLSQFAVYVPAGTTSLRVTLAGGTGDPDLYLFRPGNTNTSADDCHSFNDGPGESCTVNSPAAGVWWILVDPFVAHSGTVITATITPTPP